MFPGTDTAADPNIDPSPDLSSAMDNFFSPDSGDAQQDPPAEPEQDQPVDQPAEGADGDIDPNAEPAADDPAMLDEDDDAPIDVAGKKSITLPVGRFNNIYQGHKFMREVREFAPTVEAARQQYRHSSDLLDMHADLKTGDPQGVDKFLGFWKAEAPEAFDSLAQRAFEQASPAVQDQFRATALQSTIDEAYGQASQSGDSHDLYRAQMLEWSATGKYRGKDALPKADPLAAREADVKAREDALKQQGQQRTEAGWSNLSGQVERAKSNGLSTEVDKMLEPVKARFAKAPELFGALRDRIVNKVTNDLNSNFEWKGTHERDLRLARKSFVDAASQNQRFDPKQRLQPLVDDYLARARNLMAPVARKLISEATASIVADNQAAHTRQEAAQGRRGANGSGRAVAGGKAPAISKSAPLEDQIAAYLG